MKAKDIALEEDDLLFKKGDFMIDLSDEKHIEDILLAVRGHWRQHPLVGIDLVSYLRAASSGGKITELRKAIKSQLELDNYQVSLIAINGLNDIQIEANRLQ